MKISRVQSFLLSCPLAEPLQLSFYGGRRTILKRDAMLIRVDTVEGLTGWAPGPGSERAHRAIRNIIGPFLEGRTLADTDALRVHFTNGPGAGDAALIKVYSAVEVALFDLLGKAMGVPVSEIAGGRVRDRIRLYGSAGMYMSPEEYAAEAAAVAALGFSAYKMRPGIGPDQDLEAVRLVREAVGPDIDIMVDAHTWWRMGDRSYSPDNVEQLARGMAEYDISWLEEPMPPDDHQAYLRLKDLDVVPLASGEHEPDEDRYLDLIFTQAVDYVQMDVCCQGGFTLARRLFGEIQKENMRFAFHSWGTALEVVAAAHLGVCWPETVVEWLEYPVYAPGVLYPFPLASELLASPLEIEKGELIVPREPGLGVEIDESVIEKYPWIPGPWSVFHIDSPPATLAITSDHSAKWDAGLP
jgi:L-alanine-DL-glutamate epimerase-like enolase superfamily enzyme